jgi:dihydrofolate synthase/folylpolyglutamate synthase
VEIDAILQSFQRFGIKLGLERIYKLLDNLGNPHLQVPVIHVAGTNGKGSVCAYLSAVLTEAGYRTGRYTSPHLVDWTERITLNEQPIKGDELHKLILEVKAAITSEEESPTQFEVITAAAWLYFAQQKADIAVVEVGLGGRLDATNVISQALVTIITSISREHWQQLGNTVGEIAFEKAGIIKAGCPVVVGQLPPDAEKVVLKRAEELNCPIFIPQPARQLDAGWVECEVGGGGKGERGKGEEEEEEISSNLNSPVSGSPLPLTLRYPLPLAGQIQLANSALAIASLEILRCQGWDKITEAAIVNGMAKTKWLGRMQWTTWKNQKLLIDGAHNPASAKVLREYVDSLGYVGITWVMGMMAKKDHAEIFEVLLPSHDKLLIVPVPNPDTAIPGELENLAREICPELSFCQTFQDLPSALDAAYIESDNLVVLCGSLYLIGHFLGEGEKGKG